MIGVVWSANAVVLKHFVERLDAHRADAFVDQVADRIVNHGRGKAGLHLETVGEVCRAVEFSAAHVHVEIGRFAEWNNAWVEPMNQGSKGNKIQSARLGNVEH